MSIFKNLIPVALILCMFSCKKDERTEVKPAPPFATAGTNQNDIEEFQVTLNADSLKAKQTGKWSIEKGLIEEKVFFSDDTKPNSKFNGMPGETYELKWTVKLSGEKFSESIVKIVFKPLKVAIENTSPNNQTKFYLNTTKYETGTWTIDGKYAVMLNQIHGGTFTPAINAPNIQFQGYANRNYKLTWTTTYGSKSASATIELKTGDYLESEALIDLQINKNSSKLSYENGHIVKLDLSANGISWILQDTIQFPTMQALKYLKRLELQRSSISVFPTVIGDQYRQLEYLNMENTFFPTVSENIGQLSKLKYFNMSFLAYGARVYSLPESFGDLQNLEYFVATNSGLRYLPDSFGKLKNLKYFECGLNIIESLPYDVGNMTNLITMTVNTEFDMPESFSKLTKLRKLYFTTKSTNPKLPSDFGNLSSLDTLILEGRYTQLPASIGKLGIKSFKLSAPTLSSIPETFGNLKNLEDLQIGGLFTVFPNSFSNLTNLKYLLTGGKLEHLPNDIGRMKNLTTIYCESGNLKDLPQSIGQMENLTVLKLRNNSIQELPAGFFNSPKLQQLDLSYNKISTLSSDFSKLSNTLVQFYFYGNNFSPADGKQLKSWLPKTLVYLDYN